jgi:hypothetical protein
LIHHPDLGGPHRVGAVGGRVPAPPTGGPPPRRGAGGRAPPPRRHAPASWAAMPNWPISPGCWRPSGW